MVRSLGYSVSIGPSERKGQGEAEEGKGDEGASEWGKLRED